MFVLPDYGYRPPAPSPTSQAHNLPGPNIPPWPLCSRRCCQAYELPGAGPSGLLYWPPSFFHSLADHQAGSDTYRQTDRPVSWEIPHRHSHYPQLNKWGCSEQSRVGRASPPEVGQWHRACPQRLISFVLLEIWARTLAPHGLSASEAQAAESQRLRTGGDIDLGLGTASAHSQTSKSSENHAAYLWGP